MEHSEEEPEGIRPDGGVSGMKEVRIIMSDSIHTEVKKHAAEQDLKLGEAIEQLLVIGLDNLKKKKGSK